MCKYEMDPVSMVEDTEQTPLCSEMDRWTDAQTDKMDGQGETSLPSFNFIEVEGIKMVIHIIMLQSAVLYLP